jgi:hypothetical protein
MGVKLGLSHRFREFENWDYREEVTGDWGELHSEELRGFENVNWGGQIKQHVYGEGKCLNGLSGET